MVNKLTRRLCKLVFWQSRTNGHFAQRYAEATPAKTAPNRIARQNGICFVGGNVIDKLMGVDLSFHRLVVDSYSNWFVGWMSGVPVPALSISIQVLMLRYKLLQISIGRWLMGIRNAHCRRRYNGVELICYARQNKIQFMVTSGWQMLNIVWCRARARGDI